MQGLPLFVVNHVLTSVLAALLGAITLGIGEEIGWRAVLQPALARRFGFVKGTLCVGLVWAYWHLPINLKGYNDAQHPILTALVIFPLAAIAPAFVLGWLFERSQSVWPCAVAHMANNLWSGVSLVKTPDWLANNAIDLAAAALVAGLLVLLRARTAASRVPPFEAGAGECRQSG